MISTPSTSNAFADVAKQIRATVVRRRLRMAVWRDGALSFEIAEFLGMLIGLESRCQSIGENAINPMIAHPIVSSTISWLGQSIFIRYLAIIQVHMDRTPFRPDR